MAQQQSIPPEVRDLGPVALALWNCMTQGTHTKVNVPGLWEVTPEMLFEQLGGKPMTPEHRRDAERAFEGILESGKAIYDPYSRLLRIPDIWRKHHKVIPNAVFSWKNNWVLYEDSPFKFTHLPTLQRIAEKSESSLKAFQARFGCIEVLNPRTYEIGNDWKLTQPVPEGVRSWEDPTDWDLLYKKIDHLFFYRGERSVRDLVLDLDLVMSHRDDIAMPSPVHRDAIEIEASHNEKPEQESGPDDPDFEPTT